MTAAGTSTRYREKGDRGKEERLAKPPRYEGLEPDISLEEAAGAVLRPLLQAVEAEAPAVLLGDDVTATHDMRVALRRLRAALRTFRGCFPEDAFRRHFAAARRVGRKLGEVRDADVHLAALRPALEDAPAAERPGTTYAFDAALARRRRAHDEFTREFSQFDREGLGALIDAGRTALARSRDEA
jgi:triphosphatase